MKKSALFSRGITVLVLFALSTGIFAQEMISRQGYQEPPEEIKNLVLAPRHENVTLSNLSPDGTVFLNTISDGLTPMSRMGKPYKNIGGIEVDTAANRHRRFTTGGVVGYELIPWERGRTRPIRTPDNARFTNASWSPDGSKIAYFAHYDNETHIYVADVSNRRSERITPRPVLPTLTSAIEWEGDSRHITTVLLPQNRNRKPQSAPEDKFLIQVSTQDENILRTYPNLLYGSYKKSIMEYYGTGQLAKINVETKEVKNIGEPGIYSNVSMAPDGEYLRVTTIEKPFSNIVPVSLFGDVDEIWNIEGDVMAEIRRRDIRDGRDDDNDNDEPEKRQLRWRPDGNGISFLQKEAPPEKEEEVEEVEEVEKEEEEKKELMDQVIHWMPPYGDDDMEVIYRSKNEIRSLDYSEDCQTLFITERESGREHVYAVFLDDPDEKYTIYRYRTRDFYKNPGNLMTTDGAVGERIVRISSDGNFVYLYGTQYHEDWEENAPQPFLDKVEIRTGEKTRVFESEEDVFERLLAVLDDEMNRIIISRETPTKVPDSYLRDTRDGSTQKLTSNVDFSPEITNAQYLRFDAKRSDGFDIKVTAILPQDYQEGEKLPTLFWFYPREFEDQEALDRSRRTRNINSFRSHGVRSAQIMITQGYAVVQPEFPIMGQLDQVNDNFVPSIERNWRAIIDACDEQGFIDRSRLSLGGHSYGAFGTAHSMIHTSYFKAGIAGAGNYNRLLTPLTFQRERRVLWNAREVYTTMSPILWADRLDGAMLMYHGSDDTNVGTWPTNSLRMFHALNSLGKTTALYFYPYEGHGPSGRETLLDMWSRWAEWLDVYVKNANEEKEEEE